MYSMADWSNPGSTDIKGVDVVAFYLGGWTPHIWTPTQIHDQSAHWMMPIWVYDPGSPGQAAGHNDGIAAVHALSALGVSRGTRVMVDMEGSVDQAYLKAFRYVVGPAGFHMGIYGSASTVFGNWAKAAGPGGGWWVADWTGKPFMYDHAGVWATQWTNPTSTTPWDQSTTVDLTKLWWHKPVTFKLEAAAKDGRTNLAASASASFTVA